MELTKRDIKFTKGMAILLMLLLHLFCRKDIAGYYEVFLKIHDVPLVYYIGLFGDACVPIYCFSSGYGLFSSHQKDSVGFVKSNFSRIAKLTINYWIVLVLFVLIGFLIGKKDLYPGDFSKFISNFFLISFSYNGAWWFMQTYIILVLASPFINKVVMKQHSFYLFLITGLIYLISYVQRIKYVLVFDSILLNYVIGKVVLVGTSLLPFVVGCIFAKEGIYGKINKKFGGIKHKNWILIVITGGLIVFHGFVESMIVAPFTGILFLIIFNLMDKNKLSISIFEYLGSHSTNIWLAHMFFYMTLFKSIVFSAQYPILIFIWLLVLCLISSHIIQYANKFLVNLMQRIKKKGPMLILRTPEL